MRPIFAYGIPLVLFILGLRWDKSKLLTFLFFVYFWIIMGLNTNSPDYSSYERYYLYTSQFNVEVGFALLCNFLRNIGFTYQQFRMIFAAIYSYVTITTAKRLTVHVNYVLAMFLLIPFIINVSGIRYALAAMIVCYGIPYLMPDCRMGNMKYTICVILALTIHMSALFFIVFLFAKKRYKTSQYFLIMLVVFFGGLAIKSSILLDFVVRYIPNARLIKWLSISNAGIGRLNAIGFIANVFFVITFPLLISVLTKQILRTTKVDCVQDFSIVEDVQKQKLILYGNISILGLMAIPGYFISSEYQRFLFGVLIIYYSTFAEYKYTHLNIRWNEKLIYRMTAFILPVLLLALYIYSMQSHDVMATLTDNLLFQ